VTGEVVAGVCASAIIGKKVAAVSETTAAQIIEAPCSKVFRQSANPVRSLLFIITLIFARKLFVQKK
jgi:hypothetical protein